MAGKESLEDVYGSDTWYLADDGTTLGGVARWLSDSTFIAGSQAACEEQIGQEDEAHRTSQLGTKSTAKEK